MDITATVDPAIRGVRLTATAAVGTVDWYRRYASADTHLGTGTDLVDYAPPLNLPLEYVAVDDVETVVSPLVTVTADRPVLGSARSALAADVTVVAQRPLEYRGRSVWHPVLNRSEPFVTVHPMLYARGTLQLYAATHDTALEIGQLLRLGEPLVLRSTCPQRVSDMTITVEWATYRYTNRDRRDGPAYWELEFQQVTDDPGILPPPPGRTWGTVDTDHATWQEVLDGYTDWREVLDGAGA